MPRLTKRVVDDSKPRSSAYFIWCSDLQGFGCRVHPTGKRVYYVDYRNAGGARKRMKIGDHGKITTDEARKMALATLGGVVKGDDPLTERTTRRESITVKELCADYMAAAEKGLIFGKKRRPKKPSTISQDHARIDRHIVPLLGKKLVKELTRADVAKFIRDVTTGKTALDLPSDKPRGRVIVRGGAGTAARAANFLGAVLTWAVHEGIIDSNPAHGVKRQADQKRTRRLTPDEYRALGNALRQAEDEMATWQGVAGARLITLTGCRLGEIAKLRWSEVDEAAGCFRLQDTKEGASTRPMGRAVFDILAGVDRVDGSPYVLPAVRGTGAYGGLTGFFEKVAARAGLQGVTPHTMRHSFASTAADLGFAESTIAAMLGHAAGSVTARYVHHLDAVLIAAADRVAARISAMLDGREAEIVNIADRRTEPGR
nr:site-specific integrase [Methylocystis sp. ATCC 49242]